MSDRATVWICSACGRLAEARRFFRDTSCATNAVECYADSVTYHELATGRVKGARAVDAVETVALTGTIDI